MNRLLLLAAVAVVIVGGGAIGTGAVDGVFQSDDVEIEDEAITLKPADSPEGDVYASLEENEAGNEELVVEIDNLNQLAATSVDNVFVANYTGNQEGRIHFEGTGDDVTVYDMETGEPVESEENAAILTADDRNRTFGVSVTADEDTDSVILEDITVVAQAVDPDFEVIDVSLPEAASVTAGERVTVEVTIENNGAAFPREIALREGSRGVVDSRSISLSEGEQQTLEFEYRTRGTDADGDGLARFGVNIAGSEARLPTDAEGAATIQVGEPEAEFSVSDISLEQSQVTAGSTATATATVENVGGDTGTETVNLLVNGESVDSAELTLDDGESEEIELSYVPVLGQVGQSPELRVQSATDETDREPLTVADPATFEIVNDEIDVSDSTLTTGDTLNVEAEIKNTGAEGGIARTWFVFDGSREAFRTIDLGAGESETIEFSTKVDDRDVGEDLPVFVATKDNVTTETVSVRRPAEFDVAIDDVSAAELSQGDSVTVDATVANVGGTEESQTVTLQGEGFPDDTQEVTLGGGESQSVTLTADTNTDVDPGDLELTVDAGDDTETASVRIRQPATFTVNVDSATDPVFADEQLTVQATVANEGEDTGSETVEFLVEGETADTQTVEELAGGDSETVEFTTDIDEEDISSGNLPVALELESGDDGVSETVEVLEPLEEPFFRVEDAAFEPTDATQFDDQTVTAEATVRNTGDETGSQTVEFTVDGQLIDTETVELEGGETADVAFSVAATDLETGTRTLAVATADTDRTADVTVREPAPASFDATLTNVGPDETLTDSSTVNIDIENTGELSGTATVELTYGTDAGRPFTRTTSTDIEIAPGATETASLSVDLGGVARAGEFNGDLETTVTGGDGATMATRSVVLNFGSVASAVDAASADQDALVGSGLEPEPVTVDEPITIRGVSDPVVKPDVGSGESAFSIEADGARMVGLTMRPENAEDGATGVEVPAGTVDIDLTGLTIQGSEWDPAIDAAGDRIDVQYALINGADYGVYATGDDLIVRDSEITNAGNATELTGGPGGAANVTIRNTALTDNTRGVFADTGSHTMTGNNIERNDAAIQTIGTEAEVFISAPNNWWGRAAGPIVFEESNVPKSEADILSNVVFTAVSQPYEGAEYSVGDGDFAGTTLKVAEDDNLTLSVDVENDGGTAGATDRQDIEFLVDGTVVDSQTVQELGPGESKTVTLEYEPDSVTKGINAEIRSDDDDTQFTVDVLTAATYTVDSVDAAESVTAGESLTVSADISNTGEADGTKDVVLSADGTEVDRTTVDITGDTSDTVELEYTPDSSTTGTVSLAVSVPDDGDTETTTVSVEAPPEEDDPDTGDEDPDTGGGGGGGGGGLTTPTTTSVTASESNIITDTTPNEPGTTVAVEETAVDAITLDTQEAEGSIEVSELDGVPSEAPSVSQSRSIATVVEIGVPDEVTDQPATIKFELTASELESADLTADRVVVLRAVEDGYQELDTEADVSGSTVTVTAETPGFSTFIVTESEAGDRSDGQDDPSEPEPGQEPDEDDDPSETESEQDGQDSDGAADPSEPEPGEEEPTEEPAELPGFGAGIALVALLAAAFVALRRAEES